MARYYFDISDEDGEIRDKEGVDIERGDQVQREVGRILSDLIREAVTSQRNGRVLVSARDEQGCQRFSGTALFSIKQHGDG